MLPLQKATAATLDLTFTRLKLKGQEVINLNLENKAGTAIYIASLPTDYDITAIKISDINLRGGSPGKFSGFDLDAIKISKQLITDLEQIKTLPGGLDVFDFTPAGTIFTPGQKRDPGNSKFSPLFRGDYLFGSKKCGGTICVDNNIATLDNFDAFATTDARARGFISLGDKGELLFNLTKTISSLKQEPLYLYIGEVGANKEEATGRITAFGRKRRVPEPSDLGALSLMGLYLTTRIKKRKKPASLFRCGRLKRLFIK
ncbi:hypothetical protein NSMS1_15230 [Nostoc sp. MS1]|nr:hypothetical protein NSMS1_15230 [Nostoc sp. MS1]